MNQPRSIYQTDFTPHSWFENNFGSPVQEFCSSENIDDCLKYVSQELSALGYPPIYCSPSSCPYAVNCDIVKLVNVIIELLKEFKEHANIKAELEDRNRRLNTDLTVVNKKNAQLKERLQLSERKYCSALEIERQLKIKNDGLLQLVKNEKDESKKLSSQIQHQKIAYQHEVRKYENRLSQMKSRLTQIVSDKNPNKKIASITTSHLLQRNSNQRGTWKTSSSAKNSTEEMYTSVISNYENQYHAAMQEIEAYQLILKKVELQMSDIISLTIEDSNKERIPNLEAIFNEANVQQNLEERFSCMLSKLKAIVEVKAFENSVSSKLKLYDQNKSLEVDSPSNKQNLELQPCSSKMDISNGNIEKLEMDILNKEKKEISDALAQIKEQKLKLESEKLEMINFVREKSSISVRGSKSMPSFSVITTKSGLTGVPIARQLRQYLCSPEESIQSISPLWKLNLKESLDNSATLDDVDSTPPEKFNNVSHFISPPESSLHIFKNDELPKWAHAAITKPVEENQLSNKIDFLSQDALNVSQANFSSNEELEVSELQSSEEENLAQLRAVMEDIEKRRSNNDS